MITSKVSLKGKIEEHIFPKIFICKYNGNIVLFRNKTSGCVIKAGEGDGLIGPRTAADCYDSSTWEVFHGSVTLTQE